MSLFSSPAHRYYGRISAPKLAERPILRFHAKTLLGESHPKIRRAEKIARRNIGNPKIHAPAINIAPRHARIGNLKIGGHQGVKAVTHFGLGGGKSHHIRIGMHTGRPRVMNTHRYI